MQIDDLTIGKEFKGNEGQRWVVSANFSQNNKIFVEFDLIPETPKVGDGEIINEI